MKNKTEKKRKLKEVILHGTPTSPGIALGSVYLFRPFTINVSELEVKIDDIEREYLLFEDAIRTVTEQLDYAEEVSATYDQGEFSEIFESQKAFLKDPVLIKEIKQEIKNSGLSAAFVISKVFSQKSEYFSNLENTYFRERAYDILDLKQKLIHALLGIDIDYQLRRPAIIIADMLSPSDTVQFNRNFILGFLTDKGGKTSHAAILARGLRIPAVVNGYNLSKILHEDDFVILDGFTGTIIINPSEATKKRYKDVQHEYHGFEQTLLSEIDQPSVTEDGCRVELLANIEFTQEINELKANRAEGIGLLRTESIFIQKKTLPAEEEQYRVYRQIVKELSPKPVVIRTVDLGGDKLLEGYSAENELNPFLGWRAIRLCLDKPDIFRPQLKAILRAGVYGTVKILIPMVSTVDEIVQTREEIERVKENLRRDKVRFEDRIELGVMIETPAAAMSADILAGYVDFFSIGTNDLTQYVLAIDRTNDRVSKTFNTFNPAVLNFIARTIAAANKHKIDVTLCGEFAAYPAAIPLLLGMGLRSFSMIPYYLPKAKKIIRMVNSKSCEDLYHKVMVLHTAKEIEEECRDFLKAHISDHKFLL